MERSISNRRQAPKAQTYGFIDSRGKIETFTSIYNYRYLVLSAKEGEVYTSRRRFRTLEEAQTYARREINKYNSPMMICPTLPKAEFGNFDQALIARRETLYKILRDGQELKAARAQQKIAIRSKIAAFNS